MRTAVVLVAALFAGPVLAQAAKPDPIAEIEGVYKRRFMSASVGGPGKPDHPYPAEDVIEIVRYDDMHVYVRARLEFYNGHSCSISGIAGLENDAFVFHDPEQTYNDQPKCRLSVRRLADKLQLSDQVTSDGDGTCRLSHCSMRGYLSDYKIPMSKRRPIRYMDRIKSSRQYLKAIQDLQAANLQRSDPGTTPEEVQRRHHE